MMRGDNSGQSRSECNDEGDSCRVSVMISPLKIFRHFFFYTLKNAFSLYSVMFNTGVLMCSAGYSEVH